MSTTPRLAMFSQVLGSSFAAVALFGFLWMNFSGPGGLIALFAIVSAAMLAGAWWKGEAILAVLCSIRRVLPSASPGVWLCGVILLGIALRIWIIVLFPATPMQNWNGDMVSYWDLAHKLVNGEDYASPAGRAYWPPGLPFVVALLLLVFGSSAAIAYNIITFVIAEIVSFILGRMLGGWRVGCLAAFFLAVWPNFVFAAPLLNKECLLIALLPTVAYFYLRAQDVLSDRRGGTHALLAGAGVGYAALTQPSMLLLPLCLALFSILTGGWRRRTFICVIAAGCGFVGVITPWMVRNYVVLHQFVPITSGAGSLYIVTRPQSDGLFDGAGAKEWLALSTDEAVRNERAFSLAVKAIADHPFYFLSTIVRKPFYLFGQDIKNLYWNLEHAHGKLDSSEQYDLYYAMSNGFYLGIVLLICLWVMRGEYIRAATPALILLWLFTIYPIFAHSLFEAAERHRYGALPFMAIFAAMALSPGGRRVNVDFHDAAAVAGVLPSAWRGLARPRS